jgi:predicted transcriptional regulator
MSYTMRKTLTISLPADLRRRLVRSARERKITTSEYVRDALERRLAVERFKKLRAKLVPKARAIGIYTDEDVFKIVS